MAFEYRPFQNPYAATIGEMIARRGDIAAQGAQQIAQAQARATEIGGQAWAGAAQQIGGAVNAGIQHYQQQQRDIPRQQLEQLQVQAAQGQLQDRQMAQQTAMQAREAELTTQIGLRLHDAIRTKPDDPTSWLEAMQQSLNDAERLKLITSEQAQAFGEAVSADPSKVAQVAKAWIGAGPRGQALLDQTLTVKPGEKVVNKFDPSQTLVASPEHKEDYTINGQRFDGGTRLPIGPVQPTQTPPKSLEAKEGFVIKGTTNVPSYNPADGSWAFAGNPVAPELVVRSAPAKDPMAQAMSAVALQTAQLNLSDKQRRDSNILAVAQGMQDGTIPPDPEGLQRQGLYADVIGALAKNGVNFSTLRQQYLAQKRLIQTENSPQGVRLDVAVRSGFSMYDKLDELSSQWDGKGWGPLSRANLKLATEGALGQHAQQLAVQLNGQIAQLTSDVATVEQNGMTPTNEARKVAEQGLQSWWGDGTIKAMTAQGRANMRIRNTARTETVPLVPGQAPPSTNPMSGPTPTGRFNPATGKIEPF